MYWHHVFMGYIPWIYIKKIYYLRPGHLHTLLIYPTEVSVHVCVCFISVCYVPRVSLKILILLPSEFTDPLIYGITILQTFNKLICVDYLILMTSKSFKTLIIEYPCTYVEKTSIHRSESVTPFRDLVTV